MMCRSNKTETLPKKYIIALTTFNNCAFGIAGVLGCIASTWSIASDNSAGLFNAMDTLTTINTAAIKATQAFTFIQSFKDDLHGLPWVMPLLRKEKLVKTYMDTQAMINTGNNIGGLVNAVKSIIISSAPSKAAMGNKI